MKKIVRLALIVAALAAVVLQKPGEEDFASWMEETYEIQCLDETCDVFQLESGAEQVVLQSVQGGYSPGIFVSRVHKTYRNQEDPSYHLELKASGFLGDFSLNEETMRGMFKR
ncbi:hypothetical protein J7E38_15650 [Bacillus sp. ISL-35]|uniref:hypothetical protein n=1 Tax=Bacillus sp. ISL-35 TaxID=2819122 RepID=UPI001BE98347|nr:hypothetical protein [Bacillus sp. ISL-35]MBT2680445.1 hypothetical protein [Bacillus sp. ISL-35]MBT2704262.1 hypothetical protein [Chryseobacterium sp. ISL-80]